MKRFFFLVAVFAIEAIAADSNAAGPILVDTESTGQPVVWQDGVVHVNMESGSQATLGLLSNSEAVDLVKALFEDWRAVTLGGVPTADLFLDEGASLGSVTDANLDEHFAYCPLGEVCPTEDPPFLTGSARSGESPVLFDDDGAMTEVILGQGASLSVLGFAGPRVVERTGGVLYITEGQAILNGKFINGVDKPDDPEVSIDEFKGVIFHEIGHLIGLDHTQVNLNSVVKHLNGDVSEADAIPTMFPLFIDGVAQGTPHFDDRVAISFLYPTAAFDSEFCRLEGTAFRSDGTTELQGVNVTASNLSDPLGESTSFVSGSFYTGVSTECGAEAGFFVLAGLKPDTSYALGFEPLSQAFSGGSSVEPCDPPQKGFEAAKLPGIFRCDGGGQAITSGSEVSTDVVTSKAVFVPPPSPSGEGGCSLLRERNKP